jgi:GNAT superfamily N-acetyltransferase
MANVDDDEHGWRSAKPEDRDPIVEMSLALYAEDPGAVTVTAAQVRRTLETFAREPWRGRAIVLDVDGTPSGYALLVSFYSNELGGEVCEVDELFVRPERRGRGFGSALFESIDEGRYGRFVGIALGVTAGNGRARRLYERLGFRAHGVVMARLTKVANREKGD